MNTQTLERSIRGFVATGSGLASDHVVEGNTKGWRNKDLYASLLLIDNKPNSYPISRQSHEGLGTASLQYRTAIYSLQFYRIGAVNIALDFSAWVESEEGLNAAEAAKFVVVPLFKFRRLDGVISDLYEERAQIDLSIIYAHTIIQQTGTIDSVECTVNLDGHDSIDGTISL